MMPSIGTDSLIQNLAHEAGPRHGLGGLPFGRIFAATVALSLAAAFGMILYWIGVRPHLADLVQGAPFLFKIACTLSLAASGIVLARRAAVPGGARPTLLVLVPSVLLLLIGGLTDNSGLSILGRNSGVSAPYCVGAILLASAPALVLILGGLRTGAPTRPGLAGGIAGLLAGALGATAYTIACVNDGRMFVAIWYPAAILIVAGAGAVIGRRMLAWEPASRAEPPGNARRDLGDVPVRQLPVAPDEVAGIAVRNALQVILVLGLGLPEIAGRHHFGHDLAGPEIGRVDIGDHVERCLLLFLARVEDHRAVAGAPVVALAVQRRGIMDLEEEFQQRAITGLRRIEEDLDRLGMIAVVAIGGVLDLAAGIADAGREDAGIAAQQVLHAPEAAPGQNGAFFGHRISSTWSR
jgi:hypothetical protein